MCAMRTHDTRTIRAGEWRFVLCYLYVVLYDRARKETIVMETVSDKHPRNKSHKYLSIGCFALCYTVDNYVFIKCYENFFLHF